MTNTLAYLFAEAYSTRVSYGTPSLDRK